MLFVALRTHFPYSYHSAAHLITKLSLSDGLILVSDATDGGAKPGASVLHKLQLEPVGIGLQNITVKHRPQGGSSTEWSTSVTKVLVHSNSVDYLRLLRKYGTQLQQKLASGAITELDYSMFGNDRLNPVVDDLLRDFAQLNCLELERVMETDPARAVFHPVPQCQVCSARSEFVCMRCEDEYFCDANCQTIAWHNGEQTSCSARVRYIASGFLMGTTHDAAIVNGVYNSHNFANPGIQNYHLSRKQEKQLDKLLHRYKDVFHSPDPPRGADIGYALFEYCGAFASQEEVPLLANFFLALDPNLASSPGGLHRRDTINPTT